MFSLEQPTFSRDRVMWTYGTHHQAAKQWNGNMMMKRERNSIKSNSTNNNTIIERIIHIHAVHNIEYPTSIDQKRCRLRILCCSSMVWRWRKRLCTISTMNIYIYIYMEQSAINRTKSSDPFIFDAINFYMDMNTLLA